MQRRFKTFALPVALVTLVLLSGCLAPLQSGGGANAAQQATDAQPRTITVSGNGEVKAESDLAVLSVAVTATASSADEARAQVADRSETMRQALREAGVDDDAVTTSHFRVRPQYNHNGKERNVTGYEAVHVYSIEVSPDRAGEVLDVAVGNGANEVQHVSFTLTEEARADLRNDALNAAMDSARTDADTLASAANLSITGVQSVSTSGGHHPIEPRVEFDTAGANSGGTSFEPGPVTVSATVTVTYEAE
ncbi:SIMPL domain-containing protein [Halogeometricum borinquense]|uniref:SIMPL domain-containing protein n=1 Tax=Halogeometricum borinquense TaxID=60847 RepID=A0A6C0UKX6_9EURY|nr:SIMPL domain-containing protein [Halogeometricum borinquense]QIB75897.1 SIMPL domain-containing protein [Halogeometricum borinquense]QIQ75520.1 SIMPL domain-containing protein [Halogeometricum borinquense]